MIDKALADSMRASSLAGSGTGMIIGGQTPLVRFHRFNVSLEPLQYKAFQHLRMSMLYYVAPKVRMCAEDPAPLRAWRVPTHTS